mgnify:CR=1 FL=1
MPPESKSRFESDEEIRNWLHGSEAKAKSLLGALEIAAAYADRYEYRVLRPTLFDLKAKCSPKSATEGSLARDCTVVAGCKPALTQQLLVLS